jgi:hypothetical protein
MRNTPISELVAKWKPVLEHDTFASIKDNHRRNVTAQLLENTATDIETATGQGVSVSLLNEAAPTNNIGGGNIATYDPIMINLVRRAMPNLIAYDLCGVQPLTGPTGIIFALRSRYSTQTGTETFFNEVNTAFSTVRAGNSTLGESHTAGNTTVPVSGNSATYNFAGGMSTAQLEALGTSGNTAIPEMAFSIEKVTATAKGRALRAQYSLELAQDLKVIHGLDAESELANILTTEILAEINREIVRTVNLSAVTGAQDGVTTAGVFDLDTDSNGRWFGEKFKGMYFQIERELNAIAKATRRGKGNIMLCSSDVASALQMAGVLTYTPNIDGNNGLQIDDTGNTFAGVINGKVKVYIDPYAAGHYWTVGYKGADVRDSGLFYCPYVPLQMVRAVDPNSYQPSIAFKTRYSVVANPYSPGSTASDGTLIQNTNQYYRRVLITNLF